VSTAGRTGEQLRAEYGKPEPVDPRWVLAALNRPDVDPAAVVAFRYSSVEAARAFAEANACHYGHATLGPAVTNLGVVDAVVLNLAEGDGRG
jgi:hypothetical protein